MQYNISINAEGTTDLVQLKDKHVIIRRLSLYGTGKLGACMVTFCRNGDSMASHKDVMFLKPLHEKSETLMPHIKGFNASGFDYCTMQILTGNLKPGDELQLYLTTASED